MNVGALYKITVTYGGYEPFAKDGVFLTLGQTFKLDVNLNEQVTALEGVVITAQQNEIFDGNRTGAETVIDRERIKVIASIYGGLNDFTKLIPQASIVGHGITIPGSNNRYNSVMVDGTINNDVSGLVANGMNGGQNGISVISYEAIVLIQVVIAPNDVRMSGFAGGGINAVTKRGPNKIFGSAYFKYRNQNIARKTPGEIDEGYTREKLEHFDAMTYCLTLGVPIIKNKLFFFVNAEFQKDENPQPINLSDYLGNSTEAELNDLNDYSDQSKKPHLATNGLIKFSNCDVIKCLKRVKFH